ncbi:heme-binding protein 2-like isoform X2 [Penaeus japonicus]|uniref:heme-binding protein 2-like isoform X2 n=1 Tax=Penaeus japonicus TaxID=27405 RepID=UPI001C713FA1|nr:heme-binding protein 2-like isoform X2 [Penaeus japonicus]
MNSLLVLGLLLVCHLGHAIESAPYTVVNSAESYEERVYPAQKWITTSILSISHDVATSVTFYRLFDYIDGQNDAGMKIDMTAPVTTLVIPGEGPNCENNFTDSFYIPSVHQASPPTPTNPDVYIEERPELHVFSRRFHGFASDEDWIVNAAQLHDDLVAAGEEGVDYQTYYTVGYDSPFVIIGRNNEVWFMKK